MLSERMKNMTPSMTVNLTDRLENLKSKGIDVIKLNIGEPDFDTPENIVNTAIKALQEGFTRYTQVSGYLELREAICKKFKTDNNIIYDTDEIIVTTGAKQALNNALQTLSNKDDEVIILTPCWVSYIDMVKLAQGNPILVTLDSKNGFRLDIDKIKRVITNKTKAILLNTPNNPTGVVYERQQLIKLGELALKHNFYIISDEIYEKFTYDNAKHISIASLSKKIREKVITINGFSKTYAMTGWRLGYAGGSKKIIKGMSDYQGHMTSAPNSIAQKAGVEALIGSKKSIINMKTQYEERRKYLLNRVENIQGLSCHNVKGAFYLMPNISKLFGRKYKGKVLKNSIDIANYLLEEVHVAVVPGIAFQAPNNIRIAYCNSLENIKAGMDRIEKGIKNLKK